MGDINYGPLQHLIGVWKGDSGMDIAPDPLGDEENPYYETIVFEGIGDVRNAERQTLAVVHYQQIVRRKANGEVFHHQSGYWTWDAASGEVTHVLTIPRGVAVVAFGTASGPDEDGALQITVSTEEAAPDAIAQAPFMQQHAKTTAFQQSLTVRGDRLQYRQTTTVEIYGKTYAHTDRNDLLRQHMQD